MWVCLFLRQAKYKKGCINTFMESTFENAKNSLEKKKPHGKYSTWRFIFFPSTHNVSIITMYYCCQVPSCFQYKVDSDSQGFLKNNKIKPDWKFRATEMTPSPVCPANVDLHGCGPSCNKALSTHVVTTFFYMVDASVRAAYPQAWLHILGHPEQVSIHMPTLFLFHFMYVPLFTPYRTRDCSPSTRTTL